LKSIFGNRWEFRTWRGWPAFRQPLLAADLKKWRARGWKIICKPVGLKRRSFCWRSVIFPEQELVRIAGSNQNPISLICLRRKLDLPPKNTGRSFKRLKKTPATPFWGVLADLGWNRPYQNLSTSDIGGLPVLVTRIPAEYSSVVKRSAVYNNLKRFNFWWNWKAMEEVLKRWGMKLIGSDKMDEVIYQCDICHIDGAKNVSIIVFLVGVRSRAVICARRNKCWCWRSFDGVWFGWF